MKMDAGRFTLPADRYLAKHHVLTYLEDAVAQLLEYKDENPKVNAIKFLSDYFISLKEGSHTLYREFKYVNSTPHNRGSFIRSFWRCFSYIGKKGDLLNAQEYHSLICLLCSNFPVEIIQKTARIILMDDAMDCLISFSDFLYAFQTEFYFYEFLTKCEEVYSSLHNSPLSPREPVVIPSSAGDSPDSHMHERNNNHGKVNGEGVDCTQFYRALVPICEKADFSCPPLGILREILTSAPSTSFYGFLVAFSKNEDLNTHIGKLPMKSKLLEATDEEIDIPSNITQTTVYAVMLPEPTLSTTSLNTQSTSAPSSSHSQRQSLPKRYSVPRPKSKAHIVVKKQITVATDTSDSSGDSSDTGSSDH